MCTALLRTQYSSVNGRGEKLRTFLLPGLKSSCLEGGPPAVLCPGLQDGGTAPNCVSVAYFQGLPCSSLASIFPFKSLKQDESGYVSFFSLDGVNNFLCKRVK